MPTPQQTAAVSLAISIGVAVVAAVLAIRQWHERRNRDPDLSEADAVHFARQDRRRGLGVVVMMLLAIGLSVGSRIMPRVGVRANPLFMETWLGVFLLVLILLVLAMLDWLATRLYARRHRQAMIRERLEILRDEAKLRREIEGRDNHAGHIGNGDGAT